jgi:hypothetical protein
MQTARKPVARGFHAIDLHLRIVQERVEQAHRIRAAPDAGNERIGQASFRREHLLARFVPDHRLKVTHHHRIGMRPGHRAYAIKVFATLVTQSRSASFIASLRVFDPDSTGRTSAPKARMRSTLGFCRSTSTTPI